jgi:hypothetical protein
MFEYTIGRTWLTFKPASINDNLLEEIVVSVDHISYMYSVATEDGDEGTAITMANDDEIIVAITPAKLIELITKKE